MATWPTIHYDAEIKRDKLLSTYQPVPLPVYNLNANLIPPNQCKDALAGAISCVTFTLNHWLIDNTSNKFGTIPQIIACG